MNIRDLKINLPNKYDPKSIEDNLRDVIRSASEIHPVGSVIVHAGSSIPAGFLKCDGNAVGRLQYSSLFATIGTAYGSGDKVNTFNVPDLPTTNGTINIIKF